MKGACPYHDPEPMWHPSHVVEHGTQSFLRGYAAGLDAAREAVAGLAKETFCDSAPCWGSERYLAAIDALRGER